MTTIRKQVTKQQVGATKDGPVHVLEITYADGRRTWGVGTPGMLTLFGSNAAAARRYARDVIRDER